MPETGTIGSLERILYLKRLPMLANLPSAELAALAQNTRERYFSKGEELLREGEAVGVIHLIVHGRVRVSRGGRVLGEMGADAPLGGLALLARDDRGIGAVAITDTFVLCLDRDALIEVCDDHFVIVHEMIHLIAPTHSEQFLALMNRYYPAWREARAELNELPLDAAVWNK